MRLVAGDKSQEGIKKSAPLVLRDGYHIFRVTTLIPTTLLSIGSLQRTNIRVSCNGEIPSVPTQCMQHRSSRRSFIGLHIPAHTNRRLSDMTQTDYFLPSLDLRIILFASVVKLEHIVRN